MKNLIDKQTKSYRQYNLLLPLRVYDVDRLIKQQLNASYLHSSASTQCNDVHMASGIAEFEFGYQSKNHNSKLDGMKEIFYTVTYSQFECVVQLIDPDNLMWPETIDLSKAFRKMNVEILGGMGSINGEDYIMKYAQFQDSRKAEAMKPWLIEDIDD